MNPGTLGPVIGTHYKEGVRMSAAACAWAYEQATGEVPITIDARADVSRIRRGTVTRLSLLEIWDDEPAGREYVDAICAAAHYPRAAPPQGKQWVRDLDHEATDERGWVIR